MRIAALLLAAMILGGPTVAQESESYRLSDYVFNAGSEHALTSGNHRITLSVLGEGLAGTALRSDGYRLDGSFGLCYPPPGEVHDVGFVDDVTLQWDAEKSVGHYNLHRGVLRSAGDCQSWQSQLPTAVDPDTPLTGQGYFYLVTASNRLREEGPMGQGREACPPWEEQP